MINSPYLTVRYSSCLLKQQNLQIRTSHKERINFTHLKVSGKFKTSKTRNKWRNYINIKSLKCGLHDFMQCTWGQFAYCNSPRVHLGQDAAIILCLCNWQLLTAMRSPAISKSVSWSHVQAKRSSLQFMMLYKFPYTELYIKRQA